MASSPGQLVLELLGQQDPLDDVQSRVRPGIKEVSEVVAEQPVVHEGLVLLVLQERLNDGGEEAGVFPREEEVQFVAGVLRVLLSLGGRIESGPFEHEAEFGKCGILRESAVEAVDPREAVVDLEPRKPLILSSLRAFSMLLHKRHELANLEVGPLQ